MCYSAMVEQRLSKLERTFQAAVDEAAFEELFELRLADDSVKIPKAMEANFYDAATGTAARIRELIREYHAQRAKALEAKLFKQKRRLADAERTLAQKETKKALESKRIASNKVRWHLAKLDELKRTTLKESDSRIFPMWYAPVVVSEAGRKVLRPMRYHCRPAGKPEFYDRKFEGLYNARRDSLEKFWKDLFGHDHGLIVVTSFYENVAKHAFERRALAPGERKENLVLHFRPTPPHDMLVACLWSRWEAAGKRSLNSFAAITDEPPEEVRATGHDRCIVPLRSENVDAWLTPEGRSRIELDRMLKERDRPYYEHRLAA